MAVCLRAEVDFVQANYDKLVGDIVMALLHKVANASIRSIRSRWHNIRLVVDIFYPNEVKWDVGCSLFDVIRLRNAIKVLVNASANGS